MHPNDGRVASNFIVQALKGEPITIYDKDAQLRTVEDIFRGGYTAAKTPAP